jgi:hypothetical protein
MRALSLDKKYAAAWCHLGATMNTDEFIFIAHGKEKTKYYRSTCFHHAIAIDPQNPEIWFMLASCLTDQESLTFKEKLYNRLQCYIHILEMQPPFPAVQKRAWIALNQHLARNESCTVNGVSYSKDECTVEALTCDDQYIAFDNLDPLPNKILQPELPAATIQNSAPPIMPAATLPALSPNTQVVITPNTAIEKTISALGDTNEKIAVYQAPAPQPTTEQQPKSSTGLNTHDLPFFPSCMPTSFNQANNAPPVSHELMNPLKIEEIPYILFIGYHASVHTLNDGSRQCSTCAINLSQDEIWADHTVTKLHQTKARESIAMELDKAREEGKLKPLTPHYCCTICHSVISGNKNLSLHINGQRHQTRSEIAQISPCCDFIFCSEDELAEHIEMKGEQHMSFEDALAGATRLSGNEPAMPTATQPHLTPEDDAMVLKKNI